MEMEEVKGKGEFLSPPILIVGVAVDASKKSKHVVRWALDKFIPEGRISVKLLHVRSKVMMVPTPMGNQIPITKVRDDVASAYKKEVEWKTHEMLLPFKKMCAQRQVESDIVVIESDDIADAISEEVNKLLIRRLVIGASSSKLLTRKIKGRTKSSKISGCVPSFCTVYAVSKGQLLSVRTSASETDESMKDESDASISSGIFSSHSSSKNSVEWTDSNTTPNSSRLYPSSLEHTSVNLISSRSRSLSSRAGENFMSASSAISDLQHSGSTIFGNGYLQSDNSFYNLKQTSISENIIKSSELEGQIDINFELEKLRIELRHYQGMCDKAQNESIIASQQLKELNASCKEDAIKLEVVRSREEKVRELADEERKRREAAEKLAKVVRKCAENEVSQRKGAEEIATREAYDIQRLDNALAHSDDPYKKYTWEEIESATSSFSESLKIGMGANGVVYKASFHHTIAAVKVLHCNEGHKAKQFKQELDILGRIRHPHLLLLLGACPERGCLVYEYMENGSLQDRLHQKNDTPVLPWYLRFRIAWEVASALVFLHKSKPDPIVHRDLKPANILLDENFVSKIGDVGLSTLLPNANASMSTMYKETAPVGTMCYIDPEYQRTGIVSIKSDVYALGIVILELLTAKQPMGLAHVVERAVENGCLMDILDSGAGQWPSVETQELAQLGLSCAELRRRDRPGLKDQVLPVLERLKEIADKAHDMAQGVPSVPPNHFLCPILKEVMDDPCVASDGYTYDRRAIEIWFGMNDKSPMTNLQLPDKCLITNHALRSAIDDWKPRSR